MAQATNTPVPAENMPDYDLGWAEHLITEALRADERVETGVEVISRGDEVVILGFQVGDTPMSLSLNVTP